MTKKNPAENPTNERKNLLKICPKKIHAEFLHFKRQKIQ